MVQDPLWVTATPPEAVPQQDEGDQALSIILHQVRELEGLRVSDPLEEVPERLGAIHDAVRRLRAYISGLRAR